MTEQTQPDPSGWTAPTREQALTTVRDILLQNPERWNQNWWISNEFDRGNGEFLDEHERRPVTTGELAGFASAPLPDEPLDAELPLCGTKGCVAGWLVITASEPGTVIMNSSALLMPDGTARSVPRAAAGIAHLSSRQQDWLFAPERRDVDEVIEALNRLIADPDARIWTPQTYTYTVTVTGPDGQEIRTFETELEDSRATAPAVINRLYYEV